MNATDVAGYSYDSNTWCTKCIRECDGHESLTGRDMGESVFCDGSCQPIPTDAEPIYANQAHNWCSPDNGYAVGVCDDHCCECLEPIGFECPNRKVLAQCE